jgi:hypothetical protein
MSVVFVRFESNVKNVRPVGVAVLRIVGHTDGRTLNDRDKGRFWHLLCNRVS